MSFWDAASSLPPVSLAFLAVALVIAFGFEFINGFHDTANAVTAVIYTRSLRPTSAVLLSGVLNFVGVLAGGTAVAFSIVHLLPVELLVEEAGGQALVTVLSLLLAGVIWNLGTWYLGLPVSSSHTLIGAILGVGLANGLLAGKGEAGLNWAAVGKVLTALIVSPAVGFGLAFALLWLMKRVIRDPRLYEPPAHPWAGDDPAADPADRPPGWIRWALVGTCGGVSFAHGSNDGQKGMGLILLVLIGFLPFHYATDVAHPEKAAATYAAAVAAREVLAADPARTPEMDYDLDIVVRELDGKASFAEVPPEWRWAVRQAIYRFGEATDESVRLSADTRRRLAPYRRTMQDAIEFVPLWVVAGVAVALGVGTTVGYKRIVVTVAEKIGKTRLTYGQGAAAGAVTAVTVLGAGVLRLPVSTTHILSSGVAGTMAANGAGVQKGMVKKIALAWLLTLPASMALSALLLVVGRQFVG
ncbi:MAG: inorganic phosphate transporter [Gemmataceae bacterium]|nr:inorganic phosphate transporter [Gemmataceae bacterium]